MYNFLIPYKLSFLFLLIQILFMSLIDLMTLSIIYQLLTLQDTVNLYFVIFELSKDLYLSVFVLIVARFFLSFYHYYYNYELVRKVTNDMKISAIETYLLSQFELYRNVGPSRKLKNIVNEANNVVTNFLQYGIQACAELIPMVILLTYLFLNINLQISYVIAAISLVIYLCLYLSKRRLMDYGVQREIVDEEQFRFLNYIFTSIKFIIGNHLEQRALKDSRKIIEKFSFLVSRQNIFYNFPKILIESFTFLLIVLLIYLNYIGFLSFGINEAAFLGLICMRVLPSVNKISLAVQAVRFSLPSIKIMDQLLRRREERKMDYMVWVQNKKNLLEVHSLSYQYGKEAVFTDLSFEIESGSKVLIEGPSGSGKTTLIDLLSGLLETEQIRYAKDYNTLNVFYLTQTTFLPSGPLVDYVDYDCVDFRKYVNLLNLESVLLDVNDFPINLVVKENGSNLSGGQAQRINILKVLCGDYQVLLMDESTSGIDSQTVGNIYNYLLDTDKTIICVSHDSHVKSYFNKKICLEN